MQHGAKKRQPYVFVSRIMRMKGIKWKITSTYRNSLITYSASEDEKVDSSTLGDKRLFATPGSRYRTLLIQAVSQQLNKNSLTIVS